jgi:serine/threonine protein kinase
LNLDCNVWENISNEGLSMLRGLLKTDPNERLNSFEAINHPWFKLSAVKIINKKFKGTSGIFGNSTEEDFRNMTISPKKLKSDKVDFVEIQNNDSYCSENEETSHNFFSDYKYDLKHFKKRRSASI